MRFQIKLNGTDFSTAFHKWGVSYYPVRVEGPNGGVSQGGSTIVDLVKVKDHFELQGNSVPEAVYRALEAECVKPYVTAEYTRPGTGQTELVQMVPTLSTATQVPLREGVLYYTDWTLTLEER